jgi:hypothetical protein
LCPCDRPRELPGTVPLVTAADLHSYVAFLPPASAGPTTPRRPGALRIVRSFQGAAEPQDVKIAGYPPPGCGIRTRPPRATDATGLSPTGLQPSRRLIVRRPEWLSFRRSAASLRFYPPPIPCPPSPALKYSVMIPNPPVPQGKRHTGLLRNGSCPCPEDKSAAPTMLPSPQAALMADLSRPGWLWAPGCGVRHYQLTRQGFRQADCSLVSCSLTVLCGPRSAGQQRLFASCPLPRLCSRRTLLSNSQSRFRIPVFSRESNARSGC